MARCKCTYDKKQLDTKTAFKVVIKEKNTYFCDEECYNRYLADKAEQEKINIEYDEIIDITREIFGYEFQSIGLLRKEIAAWEKVGTRQKIIAYLKENKNWLSDVMSREFANDFNRVRYFSTIVAGKLHDWKPKIEAEKPVQPKAVETTFYEIGDVVHKPTRRALDDLEDEA